MRKEREKEKKHVMVDLIDNSQLQVAKQVCVMDLCDLTCQLERMWLRSTSKWNAADSDTRFLRARVVGLAPPIFISSSPWPCDREKEHSEQTMATTVQPLIAQNTFQSVPRMDPDYARQFLGHAIEGWEVYLEFGLEMFVCNKHVFSHAVRLVLVLSLLLLRVTHPPRHPLKELQFLDYFFLLTLLIIVNIPCQTCGATLVEHDDGAVKRQRRVCAFFLCV